MWGRAILFAACAALSAGCSNLYFFFDPPLLDDAKSVIFVFDLPEGPSAFAFDATGDDRSARIRFEGGEVPVYAVLYDKILAELGFFKTGEVGIDGAAGFPLPESARPIQRAIVGDGTRQPWIDVDLPPLIRDLRATFEPVDLCEMRPRFELDTYPLETQTNGRDAVELGDGTVLITAQDRTFYRLGPDGFERLREYGIDIPSGAVHRMSDGVLWFAGREGEVVKTRDGRILERYRTPTRGIIQRMSGNADASAAPELLILDFGRTSTEAALARDAGLFSFTGTTALRPFGVSNRPLLTGDVVWTAPNEGYAVLGSQSMLTVIRAGGARSEDVGIGLIGVTSLAVRGEELFVGTVDGRVMRKTGGRWVELGDLGADVDSIAVYGEDGVVFGGKAGHFGFWSEKTGFCPELLLPGAVEKLLPVGDDIAVTMSSENWAAPETAEPPNAVWMRRTR